MHHSQHGHRKMKKGIIIALSLLISGCEHLHERSLNQAWDSAQTLQQKRDLLLSLSKPGMSVNTTKGPKTTAEARNQYLRLGKEDDQFLEALTSSCTVFDADSCVYDYYVRAIEKIKEDDKKSKKMSKQTPVNVGELFYCKVKFNIASGPVDSSNIRVGVKDNVDVIGFVFSNGYQIISPKLRVIDSASGERSGMSPGGSLVVNASYDGSSYLIRLFDNHLDTEPSKDAVRYVMDLGSSGGIDIFDCKKA